MSAGKRKRLLLLVFVPAILAAVALVVYLKSGRYVETDNAYVQADLVPVSSEVAGTVREVLVAENQAVSAGQLLFRLDPAPFRMAVAKDEAKLREVKSELEAAAASYREKEAEIGLEKTRHAFALKKKSRDAELAARNFISAARYDDAKQSADLSGQQIAVLTEDLKRIAASLSGSVDSPVERLPAYLAAAAELDEAKLDLARTEIRASLPGTVSKTPKTGQYLKAGNTAMMLVGGGSAWIEANFPETDLTYVRPGQPVEIRIDTYPDVKFRGAVESLSPATGAEFSVIPAQNATGNWVKIVQRVPVRIRLASTPDLPRLRAGLSAQVEIDTGHRRSLLGLSF